MINTLDIKKQQLKNGFFAVGSGPLNMLIMGSCRVCPYVNYLNEWDKQNGNEFTIYSIDPFNLNWDDKDQRVDYAAVVESLETDDRILSMLSSIDIFIHEFYANFGMFNTFRNDGKNIYNFGLSPRIDICIPNFNDYFILFSDIVSFNLGIRKKALEDFNVMGRMSQATIQEVNNVRRENIDKFCDVCEKSDVPEMKDYFLANYKTQRLFWTFNHVSKHFTLAVFGFINEKFLHLKITPEFIKEISVYDMFANNYTYLSEYDNFDWDEIWKPLRERL